MLDLRSSVLVLWMKVTNLHKLYLELVTFVFCLFIDTFVFDIRVLRVALPATDDIVEWNKVESSWLRVLNKLTQSIHEHRIIVAINPLAPSLQKRHLQRLVLERLEARAMAVVNAAELVAYSYGVFTALIVDVGHTSTRGKPHFVLIFDVWLCIVCV